MAWRGWVLLGSSLWLLATTAALALAPGVDQVRFRVYGEAEGLPQSSVSAMVEDSQGFVWLGTQDGLARFDGEEFRVYRRDSDDPATLADSYVQDMELAGDQLWLASPALGLTRMDLRTLQIQRYRGDRARELGLPEDAYTGIFTDSQARVWLSLRSAGVRLHDAQADRFLAPPFEIPFERRQRVLGESRSHGLLIAIDDDLWRWSPERGPELLYQAPAGQRAPVLAVVDAGIDALWIATQGNGLLALDSQGQVRRHLLRGDGLVDDDVLRLLLDRRGRLWIGHIAGLCRLRDGHDLQCWQHEALKADGLPGNRITSLMEDSSGRIWVGTWTGGLAVHAPEDERFLRAGSAPGEAALPSQAVTSIAEAASGGFWLTLIDGGGLVRFDLQQGLLERWQADPPELSASTMLVALRDGPALWVGTGSAGLARIAGDGAVDHYPWRPDAPEQGPPGRAVQSLHVDRQGRLWIGTLADGLGMLCRGCERFRHYRSNPADENSLSTDSVNAIVQTRDGSIWLALRRGGVNRLDPETGSVERYTIASDEGPVQFSATCLLEDRGGRLWVGTQGYGLQLLERDESGDFKGFRGIGSRQGLPSESIGAILQDAAGWLWVSTTAGLARVQPEQGRAEAWRPFSRGHGEDYFVGSALAASDGQFLFGGITGITAFRPDEVVLIDAPPEVRVSSAHVDHAPYAGRLQGDVAEPAFAQSLQMVHPQTLISLELATRPLLNAAPLRFAYRLDPLDEHWSELPARRRQVSFSRLAAGEYQLQLRARFEGQSDWGPSNTIVLQVQPPWWRSRLAWLAYVLAALMLLGGLLLALRNYVEDRRAASRALARSNTLLKQSLWGSQGELWDCDLRTGRIRRENRLPHLKVDHVEASQDLQGLRPFVHPDDIGEFDVALRRCLRGEQEFLHVSYRTLDDQDQWRWMLTRGKLTERDNDGRPLRLVGTTFDITEVRAQEDALRESQARLRMALWGSGDELWDLDVQANRVHRENALPHVELPSDLRFKDAGQYLDFAHEADRPAFRKALSDHVLGRSEIFEATFRLPAVGGGWVWVLARGRAVSRDEEGIAHRVVGTNRDITPLKAVEAELTQLNDRLELRVHERTAELEATVSELRSTLERLKATQDQLLDAEKMAALGNLVAGVTHDINTPVGIAVTAATHLREQAESLRRALSADRLKRSEVVAFVDQAEQSTALVEDNLKRASGLVRSFKQVAVDQASEQIRQIDLRDYVDEILRSLKPGLKRRKVQVHNRCADGIRLQTYPGAIYQIVSNLVLNAAIHGYAAEQSGEVRIDAAVDEGRLLLSVADDGCGMEEGIARHVFEPFFTTRRDAGGSGLGLHIVYNLCTGLLGGSVRCETKPLVGTRFVLDLPVQLPLPAASEAG